MLAFERLAEEKICEAIAAGEFDHIPGKGKPLSFDEPMGLRPEDRLAYAVLKNSGFLPEHLEWRKELETCLNELKNFYEHFRQRLERTLSRLRALQNAAKNSSALARHKPSWVRRIISPPRKREQNSAFGRGKEVSDSGSIARQIQTLRQTYCDERRWLRNRLGELAGRADAAAQELNQALVEKEIRDHRPLVFLLGRPYVSSAERLAQFDREFPLPPQEFDHVKS
jgi:hypothetical protein